MEHDHFFHRSEVDRWFDDDGLECSCSSCAQAKKKTEYGWPASSERFLFEPRGDHDALRHTRAEGTHTHAEGTYTYAEGISTMATGYTVSTNYYSEGITAASTVLPDAFGSPSEQDSIDLLSMYTAEALTKHGDSAPPMGFKEWLGNGQSLELSRK